MSELDRLDRTVHPPREVLDEVPHEERNVLRALPQRRDMNRKHVQPVKEIGPELLRLDQRR